MDLHIYWITTDYKKHLSVLWHKRGWECFKVRQKGQNSHVYAAKLIKVELSQLKREKEERYLTLWDFSPTLITRL